MPAHRTNDAETLALSALAVTLSDERRAHRFLDLTGIGTEELRIRASDPPVLAALIRFLEAYEPDLMSVAQEIGVSPQELVGAREALER